MELELWDYSEKNPHKIALLKVTEDDVGVLRGEGKVVVEDADVAAFGGGEGVNDEVKNVIITNTTKHVKQKPKKF